MGEIERKRRPDLEAQISALSEPIQALQNLIARFNNRGVIIGGIAASILGTPRFTADLDAVFLLLIEDLPHVLEQAAELGIEPRISDPLGFAQRTRVLLLRHHPSGINIDLSLGVLPFEVEMVERSRMTEVGALKLRLPTAEDLIVMKAIAHRPKDLEDIKAIAASQPDIDKERVRMWIEQFGEALDLPELWKEIERLL
jgi:predicted nucleotidyltransferase